MQTVAEVGGSTGLSKCQNPRFVLWVLHCSVSLYIASFVCWVFRNKCFLESSLQDRVDNQDR